MFKPQSRAGPGQRGSFRRMNYIANALCNTAVIFATSSLQLTPISAQRCCAVQPVCLYQALMKRRHLSV